jgi:preprotein translocase subunit SecB
MAENPESNGSGTATGSQADNTQQFAIQKLYLKDCSLETPGTPDVFTQAWKPEAKVELNTRHESVGDDLYEVVVTVTVTATVDEKTAYLCEAHQAGVFSIGGFEQPATEQLLGAYCPGVLFPYAREAITDLTAKAGFPPMTLAPVNFDALYARRRQRAAQEAAAEGGEESSNGDTSGA